MRNRSEWTGPRTWKGDGAVGLLALLFVLLVVPPVIAQDEPVVVHRVPFEQFVQDWKDCGLRHLDDNAFVQYRSPFAKRQPPSATIEVEYGDGFTPEVRAAFERAVEIWERHVASPLTIRVDARFELLEDRTLGAARSNQIYAVDETGDDEFDTVYGDALVDALTGEDQNPREPGDATPPDIVATFNKSRDDWHFGAGDAPEGTIDFTTIVLHEIGHGLNYFDLFSYEEGVGEYGIDWDGSGSVDDDERFLGIYGTEIAQQQAGESFRFLGDRSAFPTPSDELGEALTSDRLFFNGAVSKRAAEGSSGPVPPKVYAPPEYDDQSSISHLDDSTYTFGTENALMTPQIRRAETLRRPGPVVCGQLADMGWTLGPGCAFEDVSIEIVSAEPQRGASNRGSVRLTWRLSGEASIAEFGVEQKFFDRLRRKKTVSASGEGEYSTTFEGLTPGDHTFRINYVTTDSVTVHSGDPVTVTVEAQQPEISVYPNPFRDVAKVAFVLPERQRVRVEVFDALGRHVATPFVGEHPADDARPVVFNAGRLTELGSGLYFFRVEGQTFAQMAQAIRVR